MTMLKVAGIMDPFQKILCPDIWTADNKLRPGIRYKLLKHIEKVLGYPLSILNVVNLIGATTTYQWTWDGDLDLSVALKPEFDYLQPELHQRCKAATNRFKLTGTDHNINVFVNPSTRKMRTQSLSGGFDLLANKWIRFPDRPTIAARRRFDMEMPYLKLQQNELKRQVQQLIRNPNKLKESMDIASLFGTLDQNRKIGYDFAPPAGGNLSSHNAAFKYSLKGQNYELIDRLYNALKAKNFELPRY